MNDKAQHWAHQWGPLLWFTIVAPPVAVLIAALLMVRGDVDRIDVAIFAVMFVVTLVGVEAGFHRHLAHRSFDATPAVRTILAVLGSMAVQGSPIWWAGVHRTHHRYADLDDDPHSPIEGLLHAHVGWLFRRMDPPGWRIRARYLFKDRIVRYIARLYLPLVAAGLFVPALIGAVAEQSLAGFAHGLLWGGLVRLFFVSHIVWAINSICHRYGSRPYRIRDHSANVAWLALPSMGFSWHNNHHASPASAVTSHHWWQLDLTGLIIQALARLGLAWNVKVADVEQLESRFGTAAAASVRSGLELPAPTASASHAPALRQWSRIESERRVERELTPYERIVWLLDREVPANVMVYRTVRGCLSPDLVRAGLDRLVVRYPILHARIERHGWSGARFREGGICEIPLRVVDGASGSLQTELEWELNHRLNAETGPLSRAFLICHARNLATLALTVHHSISDGVSCGALVHEMLMSIDRNVAGEDAILESVPPALPATARYPADVRGFQGAKACYDLVRRLTADKRKPLFPTIETWAPPSERRAQLVMRSLDPELTKVLVATARRQKTTMLGLVVAAKLLAVAREQNANSPQRGFVGIGVSLRKRLSPPMGIELGNAGAVAFCSITVDPKMPLWDLARRARLSVSASMKRDDPLAFLRLGDYTSTMLRMYGSGVQGSRRIATLLSNPEKPRALGASWLMRKTIQPLRHFEIEASGGAVPPSANGSFMSVGTIARGRLTWNFLSSSPLHSRGTTERIADASLNILREAAAEVAAARAVLPKA